jgi:hypothetical protein
MYVIQCFIKETKIMKTEMLALRISPELVEIILEYANEHKWTKSFAVCEILSQFFSKENRVS